MYMFQKKNLREPPVFYSRSKEIIHAPINKIQDVTRYNSAKFNVYHYKSNPNRESTPIKAPSKTQTTQEFLSPRKTQKEMMLLSIAKSFDNLPKTVQQTFVVEGAKTPIRAHTSLPLISDHHSRKIPFILNDYHIRETNPGFARNDFGGFFTH